MLVSLSVTGTIKQLFEQWTQVAIASTARLLFPVEAYSSCNHHCRCCCPHHIITFARSCLSSGWLVSSEMSGQHSVWMLSNLDGRLSCIVMRIELCALCWSFTDHQQSHFDSCTVIIIIVLIISGMPYTWKIQKYVIIYTYFFCKTSATILRLLLILVQSLEEFSVFIFVRDSVLSSSGMIEEKCTKIGFVDIDFYCLVLGSFIVVKLQQRCDWWWWWRWWWWGYSYIILRHCLEQL